MKTIFTSVVMCVCLFLSAQEPVPYTTEGKGVSPLNQKSEIANPKSTIRAVVVGISDYQDNGIPDLRFADKDAEAFAQWLRSPAGGNVPDDHIELLTNEKATLGQFGAALSWLLEQSREGDQAIIYFSGHGDVDSKMMGQEGFLLLWDATSKSYLMGGTFQLELLKKVVTTLSIQNKSKVILITDACRSGKLAGTSIGGAQITNFNLSQRFSNEIKILSCQPDEYSIESEQWGGGRGAFSYHLVDGLYGMADREADGTVTLSDIDRYLEDHVTKEVAPMQQTPMIVGDKKERLAQVFPDVLALWKKEKEGQQPQFRAVEQRGFEEEVLATVDTATEEIYRSFLKALDEKKFFEPADACADVYYELLIKEPSMERLHSGIRRKYAAALQDDAQQAVNAMMKSDIDEFNLAQGREEKYKTFSRQLERAAELLGKDHYFYPSLMARKCFFEAYLIHSANMMFPDEATGRKALRHYWKTLEWQPDFPLAYLMIDFVYQLNIPKPDSAEYFARQALKLAPQWAMPYGDIAALLMGAGRIEEAFAVIDSAILLDPNVIGLWLTKGQMYVSQNRFLEAEQTLIYAISLDSNVVQGPQNLAGLYRDSGKYDKAEKLSLKVIEKDISLSNPDGQLGWDYGELGLLYRFMGRYAEAERILSKAVELNETLPYSWYNLGAVYLQLNKLHEAEIPVQKGIEVEHKYPLSMKNLGTLHLRKGKTDEARAIFEETISKYPGTYHGYLGMAGYYATAKNSPLAIEYAEKAFQRYNHCNIIKDDFDLAPLRDTPEFKALVEKYCPDQHKD